MDPLCESFPDARSVLLVMKTGASEAFARLPTQLLTTLRCVPPRNFVLFGDLDQDVGGHRVHDSLSGVRPDARDGNPDFDLYRRQRACRVDQEQCNKLLGAGGDTAGDGWRLDKYKNVHIAERAWAMRPGFEWYLFVDADTYVLWPNLMKWVGMLDARKKLYLGSWTAINDFIFGHGGSGYLLSGAAMEAFVGKHPGVGREYDFEAKSSCCGDYVFAKALKAKTDLDVQQMVGRSLVLNCLLSSSPLHGARHFDVTSSFRRGTRPCCRDISRPSSPRPAHVSADSPSHIPSRLHAGNAWHSLTPPVALTVAHHQRREAVHAPVRPHALVPPGGDHAPHEFRGDQCLLAL
jgi:hypothetical protein